MSFGSDSQSLIGAGRYSDLHSGVASALMGILNVKYVLV